jgi:dipeptidase
MNERGVAVDGTVSTTVSDEYAALDPLKEEGDGLRESILPAVIACQAVSAEDGVKILASYIDRYGSAECSTTLISDRNEAWIFEIYGGSTYAAMRLPEDRMAVFGNEIMLGWADLDAKDGFVFSPKLRGCLEKLKDPVKKGKNRYHLARSIEPGPRSPYSNMRTWRGHQLFAPSSTGEYSDDEFYDLLFRPEKKVSVTEIMQLYGDRYEGTKYDMRDPENEDMRPIGVTRQSDVHIIQTYGSLPDSCCQLQWLAMGNAEHAVFVPAFSGITDTFEKYKVDNDGSGVNDSYYYVCKSICSVAESDREYLSPGVKDFNLAQEKKMQEEITAALPDVKAAYESSEEEGEAFVTDLALRMAEEQYANAQDMYRRLLFTQMDNLNDRAENEGKTVFCMPGFE